MFTFRMFIMILGMEMIMMIKTIIIIIILIVITTRTIITMLLLIVMEKNDWRSVVALLCDVTSRVHYFRMMYDNLQL